MLLISCICFGTAFFLLLSRLHQKYEERLCANEQLWIQHVEKGMAKQFWFVRSHDLQKGLRWLWVFGLLLAFLYVSLIPLLLTIFLGRFFPDLFLFALYRHRQKKFRKQFGEALPQISSILKAGHALARALESVGETAPNPLAQEIQLVLKELRLGHPLPQALNDLHARFPSRELDITIRAISISRRVGSNLTEVFDRVSDMVRQRKRLRDRLQSLTAQGRMQAWIATLLPGLLMIPLSLLAPAHLSILLYTSKGHALLGCSVLLLLIGGVWIHRIVRIEFME